MVKDCSEYGKRMQKFHYSEELAADEIVEWAEVGVKYNSEMSSLSDWKNPNTVHKTKEIRGKIQFCDVCPGGTSS